MPYCPTCGAATEGRFCEKCGAPVEAQSAVTPGSPPGAAPAAGLEDNAAGAICYLAGLVTGIIFLILEPYSKRPFVRFHAFQSILFSVAWIAISMALGIVFLMTRALHLWFILVAIRGLFGLAGFLLWLVCMYKAYNREWFQLPVIGPIAAKQAGGQ